MTAFADEIALRLAYEDVEADSGNHQPLDEYLAEHFLPGELRRLSEAADVLSERAWAVMRRAGDRP